MAGFEEQAFRAWAKKKGLPDDVIEAGVKDGLSRGAGGPSASADLLLGRKKTRGEILNDAARGNADRTNAAMGREPSYSDELWEGAKNAAGGIADVAHGAVRLGRGTFTEAIPAAVLHPGATLREGLRGVFPTAPVGGNRIQDVADIKQGSPEPDGTIAGDIGASVAPAALTAVGGPGAGALAAGAEGYMHARAAGAEPDEALGTAARGATGALASVAGPKLLRSATEIPIRGALKALDRVGAKPTGPLAAANDAVARALGRNPRDWAERLPETTIPGPDGRPIKVRELPQGPARGGMFDQPQVKARGKGEQAIGNAAEPERAKADAALKDREQGEDNAYDASMAQAFPPGKPRPVVDTAGAVGVVDKAIRARSANEKPIPGSGVPALRGLRDVLHRDIEDRVQVGRQFNAATPRSTTVQPIYEKVRRQVAEMPLDDALNLRRQVKEGAGFGSAQRTPDQLAYGAVYDALNDHINDLVKQMNAPEARIVREADARYTTERAKLDRAREMIPRDLSVSDAQRGRRTLYRAGGQETSTAGNAAPDYAFLRQLDPRIADAMQNVEAVQAAEGIRFGVPSRDLRPRNVVADVAVRNAQAGNARVLNPLLRAIEGASGRGAGPAAAAAGTAAMARKLRGRPDEERKR